MIYLEKTMPRTVEAVHTHTHTHTSNLIKNKIINKRKGNIILPCSFYDTG